MAKNLKSKTVKREDAYEVYEANGGTWRWYILKHYKSAEAEAKDEYARVFCCVVSPIVGERGELGDVYLHDIRKHARMISQREVSA